jgi:hypothetical protein
VIRATTRLRQRLGDERFEAELARGRAERVEQLETTTARAT